jgi:hypothetical protein
MSVISNMSTIAIVLGVSMVLLAISISFLPQQQQLAKAAQPAQDGHPPHANPAGSNMTEPASNTTGGIPSANPAGGTSKMWIYMIII